MNKTHDPEGDETPDAFIENDRTNMSVEGLKRAVMNHLYYSVGTIPAVADAHDVYRALALAVRDRMQHRWMNSTQTYVDLKKKIACYLSAEFLMGPHLGNNLMNLGIEQTARTAMANPGSTSTRFGSGGRTGAG